MISTTEREIKRIMIACRIIISPYDVINIVCIQFIIMIKVNFALNKRKSQVRPSCDYTHSIGLFGKNQHFRRRYTFEILTSIIIPSHECFE